MPTFVAGKLVDDALVEAGGICKRPAATTGFQPLPGRWVAEPTLAWLNLNRRLPKDFEPSVANATAWIYIASMQLLDRRLA
jgi:transposase